MNDILFLYVTAPDTQTARRIADALIAEKLAACVNIHAEMRSIYEWRGDIEDTAETPMLVKTTQAAAPSAKDRIIALHPYETPCVVAMPVAAEASNASFLAWIEANARPPAKA